MISILSPTIRPKGLAIIQSSLKQQTFQDFEWLVEVSIPERGHDLNAAYNRMLRRAKGELIVSWQDYIKAKPDALQKFWDEYKKEPNTFFTAPVGKTLDWKKVEWDWRISPDAIMRWQAWEIDFAAAPLSCLKKIGGFDEYLDKKTWSFDNVSIGLRADMAGYKFKHLPGNPAVAYDHNKVDKHPFADNFRPDIHNIRLDEIRRGLQLDFLS